MRKRELDLLIERQTGYVSVHDRPLAMPPFKSYRLRGPFGFIMIGARNDDDAMQEAARSTPAPKRENLERWDGQSYVPLRCS